MMGFFQLRRARIRGLKEGSVQTARIEATENDSKDAVERHQDYGFAGNPVDGQGLVFHVDGHTIIVRKDRIAERPQLDAYQVCVWHKDGHRITLKDGKLVQVDCDRMVVNAKVGVEFNTPIATFSTDVKTLGLTTTQNFTMAAGGTATMSSGAFNVQNMQVTYTGGALRHNGRNIGGDHNHGKVQIGDGNTAAPNP